MGDEGPYGRAVSADRRPNAFASASDLIRQQQLLNQLVQMQMHTQGMHSASPSQTSSNPLDVFGSGTFVEPSTILKHMDPGLRDLMKAWHKELKSMIDHYVTHNDLADKYKRLSEDQLLLEPFKGESTKGWQFLDCYKRVAKPLVDVPSDVDFSRRASDEEYKVDIQFLELRRKHAKECMNFIVKHQASCLTLLQSKVSQYAVIQRAEDLTKAFIAKIQCPAQTAQFMLSVVRKFAEMTLRVEMPKAKSRIESKQREQKQRLKSEQQAHATFARLDNRQLTALLALERQTQDAVRPLPTVEEPTDLLEQLKYSTSRAAKANSKAKLTPVNIKSGGVFEFLLKDNAKLLADSFGLETKTSAIAATSRKSSRGISRTSSTSQKSAKSATERSRGRGRSSSRKSSKSSKSTKPAAKSSSPAKGKGKGKRRGRSTSSKRSSSAGRPKSALKRSVSFQNQDERGTFKRQHSRKRQGKLKL